MRTYTVERVFVLSVELVDGLDDPDCSSHLFLSLFSSEAFDIAGGFDSSNKG